MDSSAENNEVEIIAVEICEPFTLQLRIDGILHSHISSTPDFDVESLKRFNEVMGQMLNRRPAPLLVTLDEFALPPGETRMFWAQKESCPWSLADAFVAANF